MAKLSCPACDNPETLAKRTTEAEGKLRRERVCPSCGHRFTTLEEAEEEKANGATGPERVAKSDAVSAAD